MLTFRDIVIIAAVVVLALLWLRRPPRVGCGCKPGEKKPGDQPATKGKSCGLLPCAAGKG